MKTISIVIAISIIAIVLPRSIAQEKPDKAAKVDKQSVFSKAEDKITSDNLEPAEVGVLVEYISLDHKTANELVGKYAPQAGDVQELRDILEGMLDAGTAELVETLWVRSRSLQRAKTESVTHNIYPTEYDRPMVPNTVGATIAKVGGSEGAVYRTHATPAAFETRNTGTTLEIDAVIAKDESLIDLNLAPEIVERLGDQYFTREGMEDTAHGVDHISMPLFYTIEDTTQVTAIPGRYNLFGFHTPHDDPSKRILVILRADLIPFVFGK